MKIFRTLGRLIPGISLFSLRHPYFFIILYTALFGISLYEMRNVRFDFSNQQFFPTKDISLDDYRRFVREFGEDDNLLLVGAGMEDVFQPKNLMALRELTEKITAIAGIKSAGSLATHGKIRGDAKNVFTEPLLKEIPKTPDEIEKLRKAALNDYFLKKNIISADSKTTVIWTVLDPAMNNPDDRPAILHNIRSAVSSVLASHKLNWEIHYGGAPSYYESYIGLVKMDLRIFIPLSIFIAMLVLILLFRQFQGVFVPLTDIIVSSTVSLAIMVHLGVAFSVLNNLIPTMLFIYGLSDSIHMLNRFYEERAAGKSKAQSLERMTEDISVNCFLASFTTAIGFGTLLTANIESVRIYGIYTAIGLMVSWLISVTLVPPILALWPDKRHAKKSGQVVFPEAYQAEYKSDLIGRLIQWFVKISLSHRKTVLCFSALIFVGCCTGIFFVKRDVSRLTLRLKRYEIDARHAVVSVICNSERLSNNFARNNHYLSNRGSDGKT